MNHDDDVRYVLTEQGMRFLAARAGVPPSTFGKHGAVTHVPAAEREHPQRAVRHVAHTLGINRFMVGLTRDARACGSLLAEWRNEAESTCRFVDRTGRAAWIRPDASGVVDTGGERVPFLVEYDRGTLDAGDYQGKFQGYRRYYATEAWRTAFNREPVLLFVCSHDEAERRVIRAATVVPRAVLPLVSTTEWRITHARDGALGDVWLHVSGAVSGSAWSPVPRGRFALSGDATADADVRSYEGEEDQECR